MKYNSFESKLRYNKDKIHETGMCAFDGFTAMQHYNAFYYFWDFIEEYSPSRIIEIGTAAGGLTRFLQFASNELNTQTKIISYDKTINPWNKLITPETGIDLRVRDCFHGDENNLNEIKQDIQSEGLTLVLCDGGNKFKEFNMLSAFLKSGDVIMSHDYAHDRETFDKNIKGKVWNWCECTYANISKSIEDNNLTPFLYDRFSKAVWGSFRKP